MLLLTDPAFEARRAITTGALRPLADSLAADLAPLLEREPFIPDAKALLSRIGGRCEVDGSDLDFDPFSPHRHRCPRCGRTFGGAWHDGWWLYPYQLWLAERAVHAAVLGTLGHGARYADLARDILHGYAERYLSYPNRDNVLGPARVFFSTYLESLWLLHITIAADLLETAGDRAVAESVRERICEPAAALIASYGEGMSNRQVWNDAALIVSRTFLGEPPDGPTVDGALADIEWLLTQAVGPDGSWYEGDNYHQFAHRGLWYAVVAGERLGYEFQRGSLARFQAGFAVPFLTALPDFTYPARKDSRYGVSLRQWRFAESCELGLARFDGSAFTDAAGRDDAALHAGDRSADDSILRGALARMYASDIPPGDTGRARSSGEAERHAAPVRLSRADLGWRSLLYAAPHPWVESGAEPGSLTTSSGYTIHRRDAGAVYVALDWGECGGGHGHPDRLNLLFAHGPVRWLDDLGTGSYVDPSLHWYRSTLAHNAPLVDGMSQLRVNGRLAALGSAGGFDAVAALLDAAAPEVAIQRTVVTHDGYFVDEVRWAAGRAIRFELPVHFGGRPERLEFTPTPLEGGTGLEDGFTFVTEPVAASLGAGAVVELHGGQGHLTATARVWCNRPMTWLNASAPVQPATEMRPFQLIRCDGREGTIRTVWSWRDDSTASPGTGMIVAFDGDAIIVGRDGRTHRHESAPDAWTVVTSDGDRLRFERADLAVPDAATPAATPEPGRLAMRGSELPVVRRDDRWFADLDHQSRSAWSVFDLGEADYRRTEESWREAGGPRARVAVGVQETDVVVDVHVDADDPVFVPRDAVNDLDNEAADINGHGIQVYFADARSHGGWVIVPEAGQTGARVRCIPGWDRHAAPRAEWRRVPGGFEVRARIGVGGAARTDVAPPGEFALDVIVNDAARGRERRRGQLVLSGAADEFAYLRGDRHDPARLLPFATT